jgi:hypothetical protein
MIDWADLKKSIFKIMCGASLEPLTGFEYLFVFFIYVKKKGKEKKKKNSRSFWSSLQKLQISVQSENTQL